MKLIKGEIIFENQTCWDCEGKKKVERGILCPLNYKPVRNHGGICPHCKAKNRHSHKLIGSETIDCQTCEARGFKMEDKFCNLPPEIYKILPCKVTNKKQNSNVNENWLGIGIVGGATDYGRMNEFWQKNGDEKVIEKVLAEYNNGASGRQTLNFIKNGKFCKSLEIVVKNDGYSVYPVF